MGRWSDFMQIKETINFEGEKGSKSVEALIDTGAEITSIPKSLANELVDRYLEKKFYLKSASSHVTEANVAYIKVEFPSLNNISYLGEIAIVNNNDTILIGLDILNALNIHVDSKRKTIYLRDETLEAAKTGLAVVGGAALIGTVLYLLFGKRK